MLTNNKKNILYIGPYRQNDGWGLASKGYLLSLLTTHHTIYSVPVYTNPSAKCDVSENVIINAESSSCQRYDIIIQTNLPMDLAPNNYAKNIGMLFLENNRLYSAGNHNLNQMNEIWVTSKKEQRCLLNSNINTITRSVSHPLPTEEIKQAESDNLRISFNDKKIDDSYKFYFIGENIQRKNIKDIIIAFHLEFDISENVSLIIKSSVPGLDSKSSLARLKQEISSIKKKFRTKKRFKEELIITEKLNKEQLFALHRTCDCFVSVSYGEAFCRPAAEAVCFGNKVILTDNIGAEEFIEDIDKYIVRTQEQPVIMEDTTYVSGIDMYNAFETWSIPSVVDLKAKMRQAYENNGKIITNKDLYLDRFSYEKIGQNICQYIL